MALVTAALIGPSSRSQSQNADTTLRVTTRLVNVNVVVTDALGKPVKDLTQDDFTLLDDGQPQKIAFFSAIDNTLPPATVSLLGPDTYTNRPADYGAPPSSTILLFDTLNSHWTSQGYGLYRIRKFLRQIEPEDYIGIYLLADDLKVVHGFDRDASDLFTAIRRYDDLHSHSPEARDAAKESTGDPDLDHFLSGKDNRYRFELDRRASPAYRRDKLTLARQVTIASLLEIGRQLAAAPGRKSLIWVSDQTPAGTGWLTLDDQAELMQDLPEKPGINFPNLPPVRDRDDVERLIRLMNDAGIAVYTVDSRGLETVDLGFRNTGGIGIPMDSGPLTGLINRTPEPNETLLELASRTGGRAFYNRNDLETGIRRAEDDGRFTYNLAYAPDHNRWKGEWRKIQVNVNRPKVTVLARGGYFALPDPRPVPPKNRFEFLSQIAASPIESSQLPLTVHIATTSGAKGSRIDAKVHLNPQSMLTDVDNGHRKGSFEVMFMQIGEKNKLLDATQKDVEADLDPKEYAAVSQRGWELSAQLDFKSGATLLCVILHDKSSDAVGSVRIPLARYSAAATMH